jgi:hypothetical protein
MKSVTEIKEAIIQVQDGVIHISHGNIRENHNDFHDRVSVEYINGGTEILIKGHVINKATLTEDKTDSHPRFNFYCEQLKDFSENIEISKKFSWKKFQYKEVKTVKNSFYGTEYIYQNKYWPPREYQSNNWVFTEYKKTEND